MLYHINKDVSNCVNRWLQIKETKISLTWESGKYHVVPLLYSVTKGSNFLPVNEAFNNTVVYWINQLIISCC